MTSELPQFVAREQFAWRSNPLIVLARGAVADSVRRSLAADREPVANELDLALQTMLSLCHFSPTQVWSGDHATIWSTDRAIRGDTSQGDAFSAFEAAVRTGEVKPNTELIRSVVVRHTARHTARERRLQATNPRLLAAIRNDLNPFGTHSPMISTKERTTASDVHGLQRVAIRERSSGKRITLQVVPPDISALYANDFHYIHCARDDELIAFGAFVEDCSFPIAWVSYSPIGPRFEQAVADHVRNDGHQVVEMARAWNIESAPKNTLSALFAHAHRQLQKLAETQTLRGVERDLGGVLTAINPNLGFRGMAFRGVDFAIVGTKPTRHTFLIDDGVPVYTLPHVAADVLGVHASELSQNPAYGDSRISLLHTNLMMVLFDRTGRHPPTGPIVVAA